MLDQTRPAELNDFIIPEFRGKKIFDDLAVAIAWLDGAAA